MTTMATQYLYNASTHLQHSNTSALLLFELEDADENSSSFIIIKINSISCLLMDHLDNFFAVLPGDVADTGASPYPTAGAGQAGVGAGPVPLTEGCRPRDPGLAMAVGGTPGERPGPARGAEVCTFT